MNIYKNEATVEKRTYTANEVAAILGVNVRTVYNLCNNSPAFKIVRLGRGCIRIHKASFDRWLDSE